ncbi:MAG: DUF2975 domain-containing protein [Ruminococcus sp.]|nr:DUF2975 domain-containing protein [Ruminococcus sp.]MDE6784779.1 DUF2975 domain-containing protein [Ruminococcus sp.]
MWTKTKSLFLSRILTVCTAGVFLILTFFVPALSRWYEQVSAGSGFFGNNIFMPVCIGLYIAEIFAFAALWNLHRLLENINKGIVFDDCNSRCLRRISWSCMFAGIIFTVIGLWRFVFLMAAFMAFMLGLVMRVLKNVFEKAVEIKSENDFTI